MCSYSLRNDASTLTTRVLFFALMLATITILFAPTLVSCCVSDSLSNTKEAGNMSPEWYNGSVADINPTESAITLVIDGTEYREAVFSIEKMSDSYKGWVFSIIKQGDFVSVSCLSELIEKGRGTNIAVNFKIKGYEEEEAAISEKDINGAISSAKLGFII